jgi:hypothetical protein
VRRRWPRRVGLTVVLLVVLVAVMQWGANRRAAQGLAAEMAAYRAAGEPATVEELNQWPGLRGGSGENAVPLLRSAGASFDAASASFHAAMDALYAPSAGGTDFAPIEALVASQAQTLAVVDEAASKGLVDWELRWKSPVMGNTAPATDLSQQAALAQLLHAAAVVAHRRGDDAEALRRFDQMRFVAAALDHQPGATFHLIALSYDARAGRALSDLAPELKVGPGPGAVPPERLREQIGSWLDERAAGEGLRRMFVGERVMELDFPSGVLAGSGSFGGVNLRIPGVRFFVRPFVVDNARVMARGTTFLKDAAAKHGDLPAFRAALAATDPMPEATKWPNRYAMARLIFPSLTRAAEQHYRGLAQRRLTAVCLAIRLYSFDHGGALPDKMDDLVPTYLPSVPLDPQAAGATLRYVNDRTDPARPRVYSVGPDGVDDGGVEPPDAPRSTTKPAAGADDVRDLRPPRGNRG